MIGLKSLFKKTDSNKKNQNINFIQTDDDADFAPQEEDIKDVQNCPELLDFNLTEDSIEEIYFYRELDSSKFIQTSENKKLIFIIRNFTDKGMKAFIDNEEFNAQTYDSKSVILTDGRIFYGYVIVIPEKAYDDDYISFIDRISDSDHNDDFIKWNDCWTPKRHRELTKSYAEYSKEYDSYITKRNKILSKKFLFDQDGIPKSYYGAKLLLNKKENEFQFELYFADISYSKPDIKKQTVRGNFNTGKFFWISNFGYIDNSLVKDKDSIPQHIFSPLQDIIFDMRDNWANRKISRDTAITGFNFLKAVVKFPYEPNLLTPYECLKNNFQINVDRENPDCYNNFCKAIEVENYRTLRKEFYKNPTVLANYKYLCLAGFKDKNIISRFLQAEKIFKIYEAGDSFIHFARYAIQRKGEIVAYNVFTKPKNYYVQDCLFMLQTYWNNIPDELKDEILEEGFSVRNHDLLSKISRKNSTEEKIFKYKGAQKKLCMKIDGYIFKLPKSSTELNNLGNIMHNCVASYSERVFRNECTIVYAEKDGEQKLCIELRNDKVLQSRGLCNQLPKELDLAVFEKWSRINELKIERF